MIRYVDSSALLKRVVPEPESAALGESLAASAGAGDLLAGSSLCWVEVWRALRRVVPRAEVDALGAAALAGVDEVPLVDDVLDRARGIGPDLLRSLDALHLSSAVAVGAAELVTYDDRLASAAALLGLRVEAPGR